MRQITFALGVVLFVAASGLFVASMREAAACAGTDDCHWSPDYNTTSDTARYFEFEGPTLVWQFRETPYIGVAEMGSGASQTNIQSVDYDPAYWFPTNCTGAQQCWIFGYLDVGTTSGQVTTKGSISDSGSPPPYDESFHELDIY